MRDVSNDGRTVLFVSHDMTAVRRLCSRAVLLSRGEIVADGNASEVVSAYLSKEVQLNQPGAEIDLSNAARTGSRAAQFKTVSVSGHEVNGTQPIVSGGPLVARLRIHSEAVREVDSLAVVLSDRAGNKLVNADSVLLHRPFLLRPGLNEVRLRIDSVPLLPGIYLLGLWLAKRPILTLDYIECALEIEVLPTDDDPPLRPASDGVVRCSFDVMVG